MDDEWVVGRATFGGEYAAGGSLVKSERTEAVDSLCGECDGVCSTKMEGGESDGRPRLLICKYWLIGLK